MTPMPVTLQQPSLDGPPYTRTAIHMDTLITIEVVRAPALPADEAAVERALAWFRRVEEICSRFDPHSELRRLVGRVGEPTPVSDLLYEALAFALAVARASGGAFDPTIGHRLERLGFDRNYRTGEAVVSAVDPAARPSYRDVDLDPDRRAVTLRRPLALDLGAVAKGLAVDLAARELAPLGDFAIDAGGDLYLGGRNASGEPWRVGLRHPRRPDALLTTLRLADAAVCTSGDYERRAAGQGGDHHLLDPRSGRSPAALASATVVAPTAMAADALATAAFVLGPRRGLRLLARQGVDGLLVTPALDTFATPGFDRYIA
jgi:thiamine biosynthesis lipoprotein